MAITPYRDLASEDILSSHISGLAHSINKIESVLNMKTATATINLTAVADQADTSLRYRIYEGSIRNWTSFTIKRNGTAVSQSEYVASGPYGAVVFNTRQGSSDKITADVTYIKGESTRLETIESNISSINSEVASVDSEVAAVNSKVTALATRVSTLETSGGGGGTSPTPSPSITFPITPVRNLPTIFTNLLPGKTVGELTGAVNVLMAANKMDAVPFYVESRTAIKKLTCAIGSTSSTGKLLLGLYGSIGFEPYDLIASGEISISAGAINEVVFEKPIPLEPGIYWIARYSTVGIRCDGYNAENGKHITFSGVASTLQDASGSTVLTGIRTQVLTSLTALPNPFPAVSSTGSKYLARAQIGAMTAAQ